MIQLKQNNDIELAGFQLTANGIAVNGSPYFKQWEEVGKFITRSHEAVQFWRGDWLNYGEDHYEDWSQYFDANDLDSDTLRNEKWVAKKVPVARRRANLSWSHHYEVAGLEPEEQEEMLNLAQKDHVPIKKFRRVVQQYKMKLDLPELTDDQLKPTDPLIFAKVQEVIDASIHAIELLELIDLTSVHKDAQDFLISHLKRATGYYLSILQKYDRQKSLSKEVV